MDAWGSKLREFVGVLVLVDALGWLISTRDGGWVPSSPQARPTGLGIRARERVLEKRAVHAPEVFAWRAINAQLARG